MTEKRVGYRSLNAGQKVSLIVWLKENRELCVKHDLHRLAELFLQQTGIDASHESIKLYKGAIYPELIRTRGKHPVAGKYNGGKLFSRIANIDKRLAALEEALYGTDTGNN